MLLERFVLTEIKTIIIIIIMLAFVTRGKCPGKQGEILTAHLLRTPTSNRHRQSHGSHAAQASLNDAITSDSNNNAYRKL